MAWRRVKWGLRFVRRLITGVFVLALVLFGIAYALLHTAWGRDKERAEIEAQLRSAFPGGAKVGALEGSVFSELVLRDVELDGRDHLPMVTIGSIKLELALSALLSQTARVERLEVEDVTVSIHAMPPAEPEPDKPPSSGGDGTSWSVELPRIEVHDAKVSITTTSVPIELTNVTAGGSLLMPAHAAMTGRLGVEAQWRGRPLFGAAIATYDGSALSVPFASLAGLDAVVSALDVHVADDALAGVVIVAATRDSVRALVPVDLPGDVMVVVDGEGDRVGVNGSVGDTRFYAGGKVSVAMQRARLVASVSSPDLAIPTRDRVTGHGTIAIAAEVTPKHASGIVSLGGAVVDTAESGALVFFDASVDELEAYVAGSRAGGTSATLSADVVRKDGAFRLARSSLFARAKDVAEVGMTGTVVARLTAQGPLTPTPSLVVGGDVTSDYVAVAGGSLRQLDVRVDGHDLPSSRGGHVHVTARTIAAAPAQIPFAMLDGDVAVAADGTITVSSIGHEIVSTAPRSAGADRRAQVPAIEAASNGGKWVGNGGRVTISRAQIDARGIRTSTLGSSIVVTTAGYGRVSHDLAAALEIHHVTPGSFVPDLQGVVDGSVSVARRGGSWSGKLHVDAKDLGTTELPFDGEADVVVAGRRVTITGRGANPGLGDATIAAELEGPRDLVDVVAWRRLDRRAIVSADLEIPRFDAAALGQTGTGHGKVTITNGEIHGELHAADVIAGPIAANVEVGIGAGAGDEIAATATATLPGGLTPTALARVAIPAHVFEPNEWRSLDRAALRGAVIRIDDTPLDATILAPYGYDLPYAARGSVTINIGAGGIGALVVADLTGASGGAIRRPLDAHVTGGIDRSGAHVEGSVSDAGTEIATVSATSPLTIADVVARHFKQDAITAKIELPEGQAKALLAIVGRTDVIAGTMAASVDITGTLGAPTGTAKMSALEIKVKPLVAAQEPPVLDDLDVSASWGGAIGKVELNANEATGKLHAIASGRPDRLLETVEATVDAKSFDLAPIMVFAPGPLSAAGGILDVPKLHYDPTSGHVVGSASIANASLPLTVQLGTLREAAVHLDIDGSHVNVAADGKLGAGTAHLTGDIAFQGPMPHTVDAKMTLVHVSPLGAIQPVIDADVDAKLTRNPDTGKWVGTVAVDNATMSLNLQAKDQLLGLGAPSDMVFVDAPPKLASSTDVHVPLPEEAYVEVDVTIAPTPVEAHDKRADGVVGDVRGVVEGQLHVLVGDSIGIVGRVSADRGDLDLLGRRYTVDNADLNFYGPLYPKVNVLISHSFTELTLSIKVTGELPSDFVVTPTADSGSYTEDQLFGFIFGGDPGGDPANAARDAGAAAVAGTISAKLGKQATRWLPKKFRPDVLRYNTSSATSSASVEFGYQLLSWIYVAARSHLEALPTENVNEGEAEIYFLRHWLLDASAGDRQYDSLDVLYRVRW